MDDKIQLEIVTPERRVLERPVDEVVLPTVDGYMGVLPGHAPLLALLDIGEVSYRVGSDRQFLAVTGGFAEVLRGSVSVLARTSERAEEIDAERAARAKTEAEAKLTAGDLSESDFRHFEVRLKRALARIKVHGRTSS